MELYASPFACSLAPHIVCLEAELPVTLRWVDRATKRVHGGGELAPVNPLEQVPTLVMDDGGVLTENVAVLLYLADRAPSRKLAPTSDAFERYELVRWLSFVATELHKKVNAPIFAFDSPDAVKDHARRAAPKPLAYVDTRLREREFVTGETFSVADAELFWAVTILRFGGVDIEPFSHLSAYRKRIGARPAVAAALEVERAVK